jgi:phenylacetate-coenzyme A ligase PaaK-like adenylate-forming protein
MPVEFFKKNMILSGNRPYETIFYSSGTSGSTSGKHYVSDIELYIKCFTESFSHFYGQPSDYSILALLPGYLERKGSSLVFMVNELMKLSGNQHNGFYLRDFKQLHQKIDNLNQQGQKFLLIGVSYALLDFAREFPIDAGNGIIMETGGMKGTRKELVKEEIHSILKNAFNVDAIHSEYGMTELLSQAYSRGEGIFTPPPWMKILIRDVYDPFHYLPDGVSGGINIIDLANLYSCAFIETQDLGKTYQNGQFEILGRFDNSDIRGCNLMVS